MERPVPSIQDHIGDVTDMIELTHKEQRTLYDRQWCQDKIAREQHNQQLFTGWKGGVFIREGYRINNVKRIP